jgi:hypothetical protein
MTHHGSAFPFMAIVTTFNLRTSVTHIPDDPNIAIAKSQALTPIMNLLRVFSCPLIASILCQRIKNL